MNRMLVCAAAILLVSHAPVVSQDAPTPVDHATEFDTQLRSLTPSAPVHYLELGEELVATGEPGTNTGLARRVLVLAITTALDADNPAVAGGACLALARLAPDARERRWLLTMASVIDPRISPTSPEARDPIRSDIEASLAITQVRAGEGRVARRKLEDDSVRASIRAHASDAWTDELVSESELWPCPGCRNTRLQDDPQRPGSRQVCSTCAGNPGPAYSRFELLEHLRIEAALLGVQADSWAAELALGLGAPLRQADPRTIASHYGIDPALPCWRDGRWVACPEGEANP